MPTNHLKKKKKKKKKVATAAEQYAEEEGDTMTLDPTSFKLAIVEQEPRPSFVQIMRCGRSLASHPARALTQ